MKFKIKNDLTYTPENIIRRLGYKPIYDRHSQKHSFVRNISTGHYPRYHLYQKTDDQDNLIFDLHIDQTKARYQGQTAHRADYDSNNVKQELARIYHKVKSHLPEETKKEKPTTAPNPPS